MKSVSRYGKFIESESCFLLEAEPPRKWRNIHYNKIGDREMYCEVSNIGDGPTRIRDADGTTCNLISWDSKFLYVREDSTNKVYCPGGNPSIEIPLKKNL